MQRANLGSTTRVIVLLTLLATTLSAADLPTVSIEHLYYLQIRAEHVRKFKPDEMIEYCIIQKIGGTSFDALNTDLLALRIDLAKMLELEGQQDIEPRVELLKKKIDVYTNLLREEASKAQDGIVREGQIAADTLQAIARAQTPR